MKLKYWLFLASFTLFGSVAVADPQPFKSLVGNISVGEVDASKQIQVPSILWGGEAPTHKANGGPTTQPNSIYGQLGLNLKIVPGDDPVQQVKDYMGGKSPILRMTFRMAGMPSEVINSDPRTKPRMLFQETFSVGDHMVFREKDDNIERAPNGLKAINPTTIDQLRGTKGCIQGEGPHPGLVEDTLKAAGLTWDDIEVVWVKDITGPNGPAEKMRQDPSIDWCTVVTPDMFGLCISADGMGSGAEGTVKGARVINSTATMSRSIVDGYWVREDFWKSNRAWCEKFVAGYHKALAQMKEDQRAYQDGAGNSPKYVALLDQLIAFYGEEALPAGHEDAHGLILDAAFVGLQGNESFFTDPQNINNFEAKQKSALDLANALGYTNKRLGFSKPDWDYRRLSQLAGIPYAAPQRSGGKIKAEALSFDEDDIKQGAILRIIVKFDVGQDTFSVDTYGSEFEKLTNNASLFGRGAWMIRGHSDPTYTLLNWIKAGMQKGVIKRSGTSKRQGGSGYKYTYQNRPVSFDNIDQIIRAIEDGNYSGIPDDKNPRFIIAEARSLSKRRAENFKKAVAKFAQDNNLNIDLSQVQPQGVGIREPVVAKPTNAAEAEKNRRVELVLIKVAAEAMTEEDYDF